MHFIARVADNTPFVGVTIIIMAVASYLASVVAGAGWTIQLLQIESVFATILPSWTAWHYFGAMVFFGVASKVFLWCLPAEYGECG